MDWPPHATGKPRVSRYYASDHGRSTNLETEESGSAVTEAERAIGRKPSGLPGQNRPEEADGPSVHAAGVSHSATVGEPRVRSALDNLLSRGGVLFKSPKMHIGQRGFAQEGILPKPELAALVSLPLSLRL